MLIACLPDTDISDTVPSLNNTAEKGDLAVVNFVLRFENNTVADTNNPELAKEDDVKNYVKGPFTFIIDQSGKIAEFDQAVIGMKVGEKKEAVIPPSEKEVVLTLNRTQGMKRSVQIPLKRSFRLDSYQDFFGKPPIIGDVIFNENFPFRYQVLNYSEKYVLVRAIVTEGKTYRLEGYPWESGLLSVLKKEDIGTFLHLPEINKSFDSEFGPAKVTEIVGTKLIVHYDPQLNAIINKSVDIQGLPIAQKFQVVAVDNDTFTIKRYGLLTDKRLLLSVELLNLTKNIKNVSSNSPTPLVATN